jgi:hypothetical protein
MLSIKSLGLPTYLGILWSSPSYTDTIDINVKLHDVVHLDNIDDEIDTTFAGDRIAQEKKLLRKVDMGNDANDYAYLYLLSFEAMLQAL